MKKTNGMIVKNKIIFLFDKEMRKDVRDIIRDNTVDDIILWHGKRISILTCKVNNAFFKKYTTVSLRPDQLEKIIVALQLKYSVYYDQFNNLYVIKKMTKSVSTQK